MNPNRCGWYSIVICLPMFVPMSIYTSSAPAHNGGPSSACTVGKLDHSSARLAGEARVPSGDISLAPPAALGAWAPRSDERVAVRDFHAEVVSCELVSNLLIYLYLSSLNMI